MRWKDSISRLLYRVMALGRIRKLPRRDDIIRGEDVGEAVSCPQQRIPDYFDVFMTPSSSPTSFTRVRRQVTLPVTFPDLRLF